MPSERTVDLAIDVIAIAGPLAGALVGLALMIVWRSGVVMIGKGFAVGLLGTLVWVLWHLSGEVTDLFGISSVRNLLAQMGLFAMAGIVAGVLYVLVSARVRKIG